MLELTNLPHVSELQRCSLPKMSLILDGFISSTRTLEKYNSFKQNMLRPNTLAEIIQSDSVKHLGLKRKHCHEQNILESITYSSLAFTTLFVQPTLNEVKM